MFYFTLKRSLLDFKYLNLIIISISNYFTCFWGFYLQLLYYNIYVIILRSKGRTGILNI